MAQPPSHGASVHGLCYGEQQSAEGILSTDRKWEVKLEKMEIWTQQVIRPPQDGLEIIVWWQMELAQLPKKIRRLKAALMMYCAWNIWKERNMRVFELKQGTPSEVLHEIKMEIETRSLACGRPELP